MGEKARASRTDYTIVRSSNTGDLAIASIVERVNEFIAQGWQPLGGIAVTDHYFYQAMVHHG